MASEVSKTGLGFFTSAGALKSNDQLANEAASKAQGEKVAAPTEMYDEALQQNVPNALGTVRSRFGEALNQSISAVNITDDSLEKASKVVRDQLKAARELKQALKDKDEQAISVAQEKLTKATERRNQLADQITEQNKELDPSRAKNLNLGNAQLGIITVKRIDFARSDIEGIDQPREVQSLIDNLQSDRKSLREQRQQLGEIRSTLVDINEAVATKLDQIEEGSIRRLDDAQAVAEKLAASITGRAAQALTASQISGRVAETLLRS